MVTPHDLGVDVTSRVEVVQVTDPPVRKVRRLCFVFPRKYRSLTCSFALAKAGVMVRDVDELVAKLKAAGVVSS